MVAFRGGLWGLVALGLAAVGATACRQKKAEKKPTQPVFLVSPQERAKLQHTLVTRLLANSRLRCPRPVLRFTARAERADPLIRSLVEPVGAIAGCLAYAEQYWADLRRAFFTEPVRPPGGVAGKGLPWSRPLAGGPEPAIVEEVRRRCLPIAPVLERAVQQAQACSPYLPGRRRAPKLGTVLQLHLAMVALARHRFRTSPLEAAWLLMHTLRFGQDLCRGGTAWIWALVTRLGGLDVVSTLGRVLAADHLSTAALAELRTGIGRLQASEPALTSHLRGERLVTELERYLIPMMPRKWIPPGGRPLSSIGDAKKPGRRGRRRGFSGSIRQDLLVAWIAAVRYARRLADACQDSASGWHCLNAVRGVEKRVVIRRGQLQDRWREFSRQVGVVTEGFDRAATREAAIDLLVGVDAPDTSGYLLQAAQRGFYLAALGLHVEVLVAARRKGWPDLATVASWSAARRDPFRHGPLRIGARGTGFEVRPAVPLVAAPGGATVRYVIPGPVAGSPSPARRGRNGRDETGAPRAPRPRTR